MDPSLRSPAYALRRFSFQTAPLFVPHRAIAPPLSQRPHLASSCFALVRLSSKLAWDIAAGARRAVLLSGPPKARAIPVVVMLPWNRGASSFHLLFSIASPHPVRANLPRSTPSFPERLRYFPPLYADPILMPLSDPLCSGL